MESSASPAPQKRRVPGLPNPVVAAAQQKWLFTDEELERTPSRIDKIEREKEDYIRHRAVQFVWQVSMMLKLPPQTSMTATVYMHRFLMRYSLLGQYPEVSSDLMHPKVIAAVALFVAFKVDETMRRMKDFVIACCRVAMKQPDLIVDEQSKDYWRWRDLILQNESVMMEYICFDLQLESPYRILWEYSLFLNVQDHRPLRHAAYAFLNDSTYTVLCLQFPPRVIAAAALYAAARYCHVAFPDDDAGRPWWDQIDVRVDDLIRACKFIVQIYERVQQTLSKGYPDFATSDPLPQDPTRLPLHDSASPSTPAHPPVDSTPNGNKRSREPESDDASSALLPEHQPASSLNGESERTPKRQRTESPGFGIVGTSASGVGAVAGAGAGPKPPEPPSRPRIPMRAMGIASTRIIPEEKKTERPQQQQQQRQQQDRQSSFATQDTSSAEEGEVTETADAAAVQNESQRGVGDGLKPEKGKKGDNNTTTTTAAAAATTTTGDRGGVGDGTDDGGEGAGSEEGEI